MHQVDGRIFKIISLAFGFSFWNLDFFLKIRKQGNKIGTFWVPF